MNYQQDYFDYLTGVTLPESTLLDGEIGDNDIDILVIRTTTIPDLPVVVTPASANQERNNDPTPTYRVEVHDTNYMWLLFLIVVIFFVLRK